MNEPITYVPDPDRAESAPRREQPPPGSPEAKRPISKDEQRPPIEEMPPGLRDYRGSDAG